MQALGNSGENRSFQTYPQNRKCWYHESDSHSESDNHSITNCSVFQALGCQEKMNLARNKRACFCCLKQGHTSRTCLNKEVCGAINPNNQKCVMFHNKWLHDELSCEYLF